MAELKADDWRNVEIDVYRKDVEKIVYFILEMVLDQKKKDKPMQGALTTKGDLMGGIFDRWINLIPESMVLNEIILKKQILPQLPNGANVEIISDFYHYNPKSDKAGIAPDVLGLKINNKPVAFCEFRDRWTPVENMPQIEVKTFKKKDYMVSLRNQNYSGFLICVESNLRIDYLLPFFNPEFFEKDLHKYLIMDDDIFIKSDKNSLIEQFHKIDEDVLKNEKLGSIKVLGIYNVQDFIDLASRVEGKGIAKYIKEIIFDVKKTNDNSKYDIPLVDLCSASKMGLYRFDQTKIENISEINGLGIFEPKISKSKERKQQPVLLDFCAENIEQIAVIKMNKDSMYIEARDSATFNGVSLEPGKIYLIKFSSLEREGDTPEYFTHKANLAYISEKNGSEKLFERLMEIIAENT